MTDTRKAVIGAVASVVVVGVVVGLVLAFAVIPLPGFPLLADEPDESIRGTVAFVRWDGGDMCISTVAAGGGQSTEVLCEANIGFGEFAPGWTPDGMLVVSDFGPTREVFRIVDPATGETLDRIPSPPADETEPPSRDLYEQAPDGSLLLTEYGPGSPRLWVEGAAGTERELLAVEGPSDYGFEWASWSPDWQRVLLQDSEGRLIVLSATGDPDPRILTEDADGWMAAAWYIPGYEEGTWDPRG